MADLAAGEEERNPIFFALILQMISMTLIHVCDSSQTCTPLTSSYRWRTSPYLQKMFERSRIDVCAGQMLSRTGTQKGYRLICVSSSEMRFPHLHSF
jgi:hypothetical protein